MKRFIWTLLLFAVWAGTGIAQNATKSVPVFVIHGPTIVAFFPPVTAKDLDSDQNTNEALSDFQFYIDEVRNPLHKAGIELQESYARSFRLRCGNTVRTFRTGKNSIGYYFITPGKKPHIEVGVMTDVDILDAARKYFGMVISKE
ncbi:MAG TPA: hypothetical protein VKF63_10655 [Terracidiphilus sp.]|nr:hypothetical protein [Terracidiphilus sp.]